MRRFHFKVKAVIFDMDGVITNTMPYHLAAWKKIFHQERIRATKCEIYLREGQPGLMTVKELFKEHNRPYTKEIGQAILARKEKLFKKTVHRRFIPGARSFVHDLKRRGFALALVTGTARHEAYRIMPKNLLNLFDVVVTGNDVKRGKPHPEPYLIALKKLKVRPKDAIVIENAPFGIFSAKAAGLKCLALETSLPKTYLKCANYIFSSFKEMRDKSLFL